MNTLETIHTAEVGALLVDIRRRVDHAYDELRARGRQALPLAVEVYHQANTVGGVVDGTLELDGVDSGTRDRIDDGLNRLFGLFELVALLDIIDDDWYSPDDA
jgi:hypothetical protein